MKLMEGVNCLKVSRVNDGCMEVDNISVSELSMVDIYNMKDQLIEELESLGDMISTHICNSKETYPYDITEHYNVLIEKYSHLNIVFADLNVTLKHENGLVVSRVHNNIVVPPIPNLNVLSVIHIVALKEVLLKVLEDRNVNIVY